MSRITEDSYAINLDEDERRALSGLFDQLSTVLQPNDDDPRTKRLYPAAYHQDPEHDEEYQGYMRPELHSARVTALQIAKEALETGAPLTEGQVHAFMTVLNSLRLVLGTMLDVQEDHEATPDPDEPGYEQWQIYTYLGWLLEWTVEALAGG